MISSPAKNALWVEKYRPQTIEDCIIPDSTKKFFQEMKKTGDIQNMLISGSHGVGKTTIAKALCNEIGADTLFLNCSKDRGIGTLQTKIAGFSSSMSLTATSGLKVIIGDEFEYFTPEGQAALRGLIEQVSKNCRFIFTCNFPNKVIEPLRSRLLAVDFKIPNAAKPEMAKMFMKRCCSILDAEGVKYEKEVLAHIIRKHFPDFRKVLQVLQQASMLGEIDISLLDTADGDFGPYITGLKAKDYKACRKWIGENAIDPSDFFHTLFTSVSDIFTQDSLAQAILLLHKGQVEHIQALDEELSLSALTVELMSQCNFKK